MSFDVIASIFNLSSLSKELDDELDNKIIQVQKEWTNAKRYFNSVYEPELVDHAIYLLRAAEKKYSYLLRQKKISSKI